jgi:hypothetical protein
MYREGQLPVTMPPGASDELGPYAVAQHGEVIAVVGPKQDDFRDNLDFLVHDLKDAGYDLRHLRVIVRDEDTSWAEMVTRNGEFEGLRPLGANVVDVADALKRLGDVGHAGYAPPGLKEAAPAERRTSGNEWLRFLKEIGAGSVRAPGKHEPEPGDDFDR